MLLHGLANSPSGPRGTLADDKVSARPRGFTLAGLPREVTLKVDAHHKRQIMGREVTVAVTNAELDFGPWEQIFYGEFDGKRTKRVLIKIIGE